MRQMNLNSVCPLNDSLIQTYCWALACPGIIFTSAETTHERIGYG